MYICNNDNNSLCKTHRYSYYSVAGNLKHITNLKPWYLYDVLSEKYDWNQADSKEFSAFLLPMLDLDQDSRVSATQCLKHPWFKKS